MLRYFNSCLKATAACLLLSGCFIISYTAGQFSFLGVSVMLLGILLYITRDMLVRSTLHARYKNLVEFVLAGLICLFFGLLLLDYSGIITIEL